MSYLAFKRFIDILAATCIILAISPVLLLVAIAIRLESPGPVFYASKRVGKGFKIFDFYKFRSMRQNADQLITQMAITNQYAEVIETELVTKSSITLFEDNGWIDEADTIAAKTRKQSTAFVKVSNDPRITRVGKFIRNTSIDELPQLFNVLKGDMSIVGNRPLPVYEAELLTTDEDILRFDAPAGITGLWQVTERGTSATSASSRKSLDNDYAQKICFWLDLQILIKTPLAIFQKENV